MLEAIDASHFEALRGQMQPFDTASGERLQLRIDAVTSKPLSSAPDARVQRIPFTVTLTGAQTPFIEGLCSVELPGIGRVENIMVSRQASLGRDAQTAYFQILFN